MHNITVPGLITEGKETIKNSTPIATKTAIPKMKIDRAKDLTRFNKIILFMM